MFGAKLGTVLIAGAAVAGYSTAAIIHFDRGYDKAAQKSQSVIASKNQKIANAETNLNTCEAQNAEYVQTTLEQQQIVLERLNEQMDRDDAARRKKEVIERKLLRSADIAAERVEEAKRAFEDAVDECVNASVPIDFVRMLNNIPTISGARTDNNNTLPPGGSDN